MSKVSKKKFKDITKQFGFSMLAIDIAQFCDDDAFCILFMQRYSGHEQEKIHEMREVLVSADERGIIDRERYILNYIYRTQNYLDAVEKGPIPNNEMAIRDGYLKLHLPVVKEFAKDIDAMITSYEYDEVQKRNRVRVFSAKEELRGEKYIPDKNQKQLNEINERYRNDQDARINGIKAVLQCIILTDFSVVFPNKKFGSDIRTMILENAYLKSGKGTKEDITQIHVYSPEKYDDLFSSLDFMTVLLPEAVTTLEEYLEYIDLDKLLLICGYRFKEALESGEISGKQLPNVQWMLTQLVGDEETKGLILNPKSEVNGFVEQVVWDGDFKNLHYTVDDLRDCVKRITLRGYITEKQKNQYRTEIMGGRKSIHTIGAEAAMVLFTDQELDRIAYLSNENFEYISDLLQWDRNKYLAYLSQGEGCSTELIARLLRMQSIQLRDVWELYKANKIGIDTINELKDEFNFVNVMNANDLIQLYMNWQRFPQNEEKKQNYEKGKSFYKVTRARENKEEREKKVKRESEQIAKAIKGNFKEKKARENAILHFYGERILLIDSLAESIDSNKLVTWCNEGKIRDEDIRSLIQRKIIPNIYFQRVVDGKISDKKQVIDFILKGYILKDGIESLFLRSYIQLNDLDELVQNKIITPEEKTKMISTEKLIQLYVDMQDDPENVEKQEEYTRCIESYKAARTEKNNEQDKKREEESSAMAKLIISKFKNSQECTKVILHFYHEDVITIKTLAANYNKAELIKWYEEGKLKETEEELINEGILSRDYLRQKYMGQIKEGKFESEEELIAILCKGYISKEEIGRLYQETRISKNGLEILVSNGIITEEDRTAMIERLSLEQAQQNANLRFVVRGPIEKIHPTERGEAPNVEQYPDTDPTRKTKRIIHPDKRREFFKALGMMPIEVEGLDENNPFYNNPFYHYQFYCIPGKNGEISINTPLIAERYYEDKDTEERFATENATYFFQAGDFLVLNHYVKKDEVVKQKENVIFRSMHTLAGIRENGEWVKRKLGDECASKHSENNVIIGFKRVYRRATVNDNMGKIKRDI